MNLDGFINRKVKCIDAAGVLGITQGKVYEVKEIDGECIVIVDDNKNKGGYSFNRFELADKPAEERILDSVNFGKILVDKYKEDKFEPTKSYLMSHKDEYVVELREGNEVWKITSVGGDEEINEDLTVENMPECDIMKIYRLVPVWTRTPAKQMSQAELIKAYEDATGEKVEVVEG